MKTRHAFLPGIALAGSLVVAGCGGGHSGSPPPVTMMPPPPPPAMTKDLDTAAVVSIIQTQTSETADPFEVDNAAVAVTPVGDETGSPVSVDSH
jgi:hypothetical protein